MYCKFCGAKTEDNAVFCSACGGDLRGSQGTVASMQAASPACERTITVTRTHRLSAGLVTAMMKVEVYCDEEYMGILKVGESVSFEVDSRTNHKLYAVCNASNNTTGGFGQSSRVTTTSTGKSGVVQIKPGTDEIKLNLYLKSGLTVPGVILERV